MAKKIVLDEDEFAKIYSNFGPTEAAKYFECSKSTIMRTANQLDIWFTKSKKINQAILSSLQKEIIIGGMIGDFCLSSISENENSRLCCSHGESQKEYCFWKSNLLEPFSNNVRLVINPPCKVKNRKTGCRERNSYRFETCRHPEFTKIEYEWYLRDKNKKYVYNNSMGKNQRIKIVPKNLELTPLTLLIWFLDDGTVRKNARQIKLHTDGFYKQDVEFLISKLSELGIDCSLNKQREKFAIYIKSKSFPLFIDKIKEGEHQIGIIPICMKYKLRGKNENNFHNREIS